MSFAFRRIVTLVSTLVVSSNLVVVAAPPGIGEELPAGPLLAPVPNLTRWDVFFRFGLSGQETPDEPPGGTEIDAEAAVPGDQRPRRTTVIKAGRVYFQEKRTRSGEIHRNWLFLDPRLEIVQFNPPNRVLAIASGDRLSGLATSLERGDFPELDWLSSKNFRGLRKLAGRDCLFFQDEVTLARVGPEAASGDIGDAAPVKVKSEAWIDLETRLPLKFHRGEEVRRYRYSAAQASDVPPLPAEGKRLYQVNTAAKPKATGIRP